MVSLTGASCSGYRVSMCDMGWAAGVASVLWALMYHYLSLCPDGHESTSTHPWAPMVDAEPRPTGPGGDVFRGGGGGLI